MAYRGACVGLVGLFVTLACGESGEAGKGARGGQSTQPGGSAGLAAAGEVGEGGRGGDDEGSGDGGTGDVGGSGVGGSSGSEEEGGAGSGSNGGSSTRPDPRPTAAKVDLLLTIDNSISMAEKQRIFARTLPELLTRLVNPFCVNGQGKLVGKLSSPDDPCPVGSQREFAPLRDLHVGVITSSLGSHGASGQYDVCVQPTADDHAHLLALKRPNVPSYDGRGFLKWDPDARASPPGESNLFAFESALQTLIESAGENGCGYEATLEATYRFLVDPEPPLTIELSAEGRTKRVGIDQELLAQRAAFLRPDSSVVALILTDENDCSVVDAGYGWLVARADAMYRSTSACKVSPNDPCCQSCGEPAAHSGCPPVSSDSECVQGTTLSSSQDSLNLRCFDQKRRFGLDLLYPLSRYVNGFSGAPVPNSQGVLVDNPLFHRAGYDRDPSLFSFAVLGGVPWQDLATSASLNGSPLEYLTAAELQREGRWPVILGDLQNLTPPADPFMRESTDPRNGNNPITLAPIVSSSSIDPKANAINGHEQVNVDNSELQYACTFELPSPIVCDQAAYDALRACDCFERELAHNRSVCNPPGGGAATTTQYGGKAFPTLRPLGVAQQLGERAVLGSICPTNTRDEEQPDYGYRPLFGAVGRRIAETLKP